ncbi:Flp family type IVb pilin [Bacillus daqingensis]|uniref:Flp family type IVb pilin n=1 Tax=Bacillus daqingensis TaxID=872396 RepID=A0ABV9NX42_9BACI
MTNWMMSFLKEEDGQGMTEYGLILGGIAVIAVAAVALLTGALDGLFANIASQISGAVGGGGGGGGS